ncbi:MAG TPA: nicotinamide riboside transporter PnuC [Verrucomicrobiae bacterium]|nr:nicotinamide riboside transporter PnuC [Verrucomicrobiae bacterium]
MSSGNLNNVEPGGGSGNFSGVNPAPAANSDPTLATLPPAGTGWFGLRPVEIAVMAVASLLILLPSYRGWWPIGVEEAWGFVSGGICVWLVVREHLWNWPIGLVNNVVFFFLFLHGRLFADMSLQVVYLGLGIYGWWNWLFGGEKRTVLKISRTARLEWCSLAALIPLGTWGLREILLAVNGAAPFWDSLTTVLSLAAQYLLCRKRLENWLFWIAADVIYVPLYLSRQLPLTAALYAVFLVMCLAGLREWHRRQQGKVRA